MKKSIIGHKFNNWIVIEKTNIKRGKIYLYKCKCICGNISNVCKASLVNNKSKQCRECQLKIHGFKKSRNGETKHYLFTRWTKMIRRCTVPSNENYYYYGGRGIRVCNRWLEKFDNFLEDMGEPPDKNYQLDRINPDGDYEPSNCRWISRDENYRNKRNMGKNREKYVQSVSKNIMKQIFELLTPSQFLKIYKLDEVKKIVIQLDGITFFKKT